MPSTCAEGRRFFRDTFGPCKERKEGSILLVIRESGWLHDGFSSLVGYAFEDDH